MDNLIFVGLGAVLYGLLLWWSAYHLTAERWQMAATIPVKKTKTGNWKGVNLTYYGFFTATAMVSACTIFFILAGSLGLPLFHCFIFLAPLLSICFPASRLFARWVEKKPATATIGGAYFAGILIAPWMALLIENSFERFLSPAFEIVPLLSALSISYIVGEGMGRLACISFGCCYGIPLDQGPAWARYLFRRRHFTFFGPMKKASYESGYGGKPLVPIQLITSMVYGVAGLAGLYLFLQGSYTASFLVTGLAAGLWRAYSELLRADYRGQRRFTAYQKMALCGALYVCFIPWVFGGDPALTPQVRTGLSLIWNPVLLLTLQALWIYIMLATGTSKVTRATIKFHLIKSKI